MGKIYQHAEDYLGPISESLMVEIGSERGEGSTLWLADLAQRHKTFLHSIDIDPVARSLISHPNLCLHTDDGQNWIQKKLPALGRKVCLVYLDNFDYIWRMGEPNQRIDQQKQFYKNGYDLDMTNRNCQLTHMRQMVSLLPYTVAGTVAIFDDTYLINDCWAGKCGPIVVWLQAQGWKLMLEKDFGVIMVRGIQ